MTVYVKSNLLKSGELNHDIKYSVNPTQSTLRGENTESREFEQAGWRLERKQTEGWSAGTGQTVRLQHDTLQLPLCLAILQDIKETEKSATLNNN